MQAAGGLDFRQAPPFSVPLRFFLTAPVFLFLAGLLLFTPGAASWQRWSPAILAAVHLVTLGFLAMVMMGAFLQLLAVVAGAPVARPRLLAGLVYGPLTLGTLSLAGGFWLSDRWLFYPALALLAAALATFALAAAASLRGAARNATVFAMAAALFALAVTLALGLALGATRAGGLELANFVALADLHATWGLLGWVFVLVAGVAYQVVPMFQLTPAYPRRLTRYLVPLFMAGLLDLSWAREARSAWPGDAVALFLAACLLVFALATFYLQHRRRRRVADVTLDYWRVGMACLVGAALLGPSGVQRFPALLGILFLYGFAVSVVSGMLYKILPFLAWFHLQSRTQAPAGTIPNMKSFLPEVRARRQFAVHVATLGLLLLGTLSGGPWRYAAAAGVCLSALMLTANLWGVWRLFRAQSGRSG